MCVSLFVFVKEGEVGGEGGGGGGGGGGEGRLSDCTCLLCTGGSYSFNIETSMHLACHQVSFQSVLQPLYTNWTCENVRSD